MFLWVRVCTSDEPNENPQWNTRMRLGGDQLVPSTVCGPQYGQLGSPQIEQMVDHPAHEPLPSPDRVTLCGANGKQGGCNPPVFKRPVVPLPSFREMSQLFVAGVVVYFSPRTHEKSYFGVWMSFVLQS
jgi:hypothetical protein